MCGIGGYYCWADARPPQSAIKALLLANQARGRSAAGIAYLDASGRIVHRKQKGPAEDLVKSLKPKTWEEIAASPRALIHARATTKGTEDVNVNNHPVVGFGWVVVHNGFIMNDDDLFEYYKANRFAEVDTAAIPLVLSQGKDFIESLQYLSLLSGSATLAAWSVKNPEFVTLAKLGMNDVWLLLDEPNQIFYWSSTESALLAIPGARVGPLRMRTVRQLPENHILVLSPEGKDATRLFAVTRSPFLPVARLRTRGRMAQTGFTGTASKIETKDFSFKSSQDKTRPLPCWDNVIHTWMILGLETNAFSQQRNLVSKTLQTPYGRWVFTRGKGIQVERMFYGLKRMKKYWYKQLDHIPDFPVALVDGKTPYDGALCLEHYTLKEKVGSTEIQTMGLVCPWCGVLARRVGWDMRNGRCDFCNIHSKPPED